MAATTRIAIMDAVPRIYWDDDEGFTDGEKFFDLLSAQDADVEIDTYLASEHEFPANIDDYDAYLVTGSPASVHDDFDWIARLTELILAANERRKRILASCFGHQLVAKTFGGRVEHNEGGWAIGNYRLQITRDFAWMTPPADTTDLFHFNQERVTRLPPGAQSFAHAEEYPDFAYTLGDNILCFQGHPEQPLRAMNNFLDTMIGRLDDAHIERARRRIHDGRPDADIWGQWMIRFILS